MKTLRYLSVLFLAIATFSCSSDDDATPQTPVEETAGLIKIQELSNENHIIELFSETGFLTQGYNQITLRIKEKTTNDYVTNAVINWVPLMNMTMMQHSCPASEVEKIAGKQTLYGGEIVFQMPQNETEFWELTVNYIIAGANFTATTDIDVPASEKRTVNSFTGTDGTRYIVAYISPKNPKVALNDIKVGVYRMQDMMHFPAVDGYTIKIDPRMPSMGNHGSPNNTDLIQSSIGKLYEGKLSLTMTGYWKINMQLLNASGEILKGEAVTAENEASSLFFEIEF